MSRPAKKFSDPKLQKTHEARLKRRRASHAQKRTMEMASQAAEGTSDFEELVEAERIRQEGIFKAKGAKGGSKSPKIMAQAREDLALAFDLIGGVPALVVWGRTNPSDFYRIWAKLIPSSAIEPTSALPLEELLTKLASKEEKTVAQAAIEIGEETLAAGRERALREDKETLQ